VNPAYDENDFRIRRLMVIRTGATTKQQSSDHCLLPSATAEEIVVAEGWSFRGQH
jgi:hypothetical protein